MSAPDVVSPARFDPESLFRLSLTYNFDPLKSALSYVMDQLRDNTANIHYLKEKAGIPQSHPIPPAPAALPPQFFLDLKAQVTKLEERMARMESAATAAKSASPAPVPVPAPVAAVTIPKAESKTAPPAPVPVPQPVSTQSSPPAIPPQQTAVASHENSVPAAVPVVETQEESAPRLERGASMMRNFQQEMEERLSELELEVKRLKVRPSRGLETLSAAPAGAAKGFPGVGPTSQPAAAGIR